MRDYGKVSPQFWTGCTGRRIRALGAQAQVMALYLMTCPASSMIGLYYIPIPTLAHETGIPLEGASKVLRSLCEVGFVEYDHENELVWVCEMARHQISETVEKSDKRQLGIIREAQKVMYSRLFDRWFARYQKPFGLPQMASTASPSEAPSKPLASQEHLQEHSQEQDSLSPAPPEAPTTEPPKAPPPNPGETGALFDDPATKAPPPPAKPAPKRRAPSKPKTDDPPPFSLDAAIDAIATAAGPRFEVGDKAAWNPGHIISTRKNIRRFADLSTWTLVGEWLRAGGDKFRGPVTIEWTAESHFSTAVMLAKRWHADGRPAIDRNGAAPEPTPEQRRAALVAGADQRPNSTGYSEPPPRDYDPTALEVITDAERARREYAVTAGRAALAALRNPAAKVVNS